MTRFKDKIEYRMERAKEVQAFKQAVQTTIDIEKEREALLLWAETITEYKNLPEDKVLQILSRFPENLNIAFFIGNAMQQDVVIFGETLKNFAESFAMQQGLPKILLDEFIEHLILTGHMDK